MANRCNFKLRVVEYYLCNRGYISWHYPSLISILTCSYIPHLSVSPLKLSLMSHHP